MNSFLFLFSYLLSPLESKMLVSQSSREKCIKITLIFYGVNGVKQKRPLNRAAAIEPRDPTEQQIKKNRCSLFIDVKRSPDCHLWPNYPWIWSVNFVWPDYSEILDQIGSVPTKKLTLQYFPDLNRYFGFWVLRSTFGFRYFPEHERYRIFLETLE